MGSGFNIGAGDSGPNTARRTPCVLLLDTSGSMAVPDPNLGRPAIDVLNECLPLLRQDLMDEDFARMSVELAVVTFGGNPEVVPFAGGQYWTDVDGFTPPHLVADGGTPLAGALQLALDLIEERKNHYRQTGLYNRPWVFILTDGNPTDPPDVWNEATRRVREATAQNKVVVWAFSTDTAPATMAKMGEVTQRKYKLRLDRGAFRELFEWLKNSMVAVSQSHGKDVRVPPPPKQAEFDPLNVSTSP